MAQIHIAGRRWLQRTCGNTYFTATIYVDGVQVHKTPKEYGYGEHYLTAALDWLQANGFAPATDRRPAATLFLQETLGASWDVSDVRRERDL